MKIGEKLKALRKDKNLTLDQLAIMTSVAKATLSRIENGVVGGNMSTLRKIAFALHVSVDELVSEEAGELNTKKDDSHLLLAALKNDLKGVTVKMIELCKQLNIEI